LSVAASCDARLNSGHRESRMRQ